jgi:hypothetical protein
VEVPEEERGGSEEAEAAGGEDAAEVRRRLEPDVGERESEVVPLLRIAGVVRAHDEAFAQGTLAPPVPSADLSR